MFVRDSWLAGVVLRVNVTRVIPINCQCGTCYAFPPCFLSSVGNGKCLLWWNYRLKRALDVVTVF